MFYFWITVHIIPNVLNDEDIDELVNIKDFEKSIAEMETYESIEGINFPQEYPRISRWG